MTEIRDCETSSVADRPLDPELEMGAYEELWTNERQSFKALASLLSDCSLPSSHVPSAAAQLRKDEALEVLRSRNIDDVQFAVDGMQGFPQGLRDAEPPVHFLYCRGNMHLLQHPHRVAVVGSRQASRDGIARAHSLAKCLVADNIAVVSGLARGIDTAAHSAAIRCGGKTIAVTGTPITESYPPENHALQDEIARKHLLVSQVPVLRYLQRPARDNRFFFAARNAAMSALSQASVVVEAAERSGTLVHARAVLAQKRKLFILESCFGRGQQWPERFLDKGAIRVAEYAQIRQHLGLGQQQA